MLITDSIAARLFKRRLCFLLRCGKACQSCDFGRFCVEAIRGEMSVQSVLAGLVVVELSQSPAAGLATMVMADFGAEVVWFEYGGEGDDYRVWHRGEKRVPVNLALGS